MCQLSEHMSIFVKNVLVCKWRMAAVQLVGIAKAHLA